MARQMTVKDAYGAAKKSQGQASKGGGSNAKPLKKIVRPQNPSSRNSVGAKPKNKKGPADDIGRFIKGFVGQAGKTAKSVKDIAYSLAGGPEVERIARGKGKKSDYAWTALNVLPVGKIAGATEKAALSGVRAIAENVVESAAKSAAKSGAEQVAKKAASRAVKAADKTTAKAIGKTAAKDARSAAKAAAAKPVLKDTPSNVATVGTRAAKKSAKAVRPAANAGVSKELETANNHLGNIRRAMQEYKGPKFDPKTKKISANWAEFQKRERAAVNDVNRIISKEQKAGRAAENIKKVGVEKPKVRDTSMGSTTVGKKGDGGVPLPTKTRSYSKIKAHTKDTANIPLEKNQRYAYEADPMKRAEGKDRFWQKEQRRMESKAKKSEMAKKRQANVDVKTKQARVQANWKEVKAKAQGGGPKAQARAERFKKFWNEQGYNLK